MSKFQLSGLSLKPSDITVLEEELEEDNWRDKAERLLERRERKLRRAEKRGLL